MKKSSTLAWVVVALLWVVAFLNYLDRILITSMRDPIVKEFGLTDAQFGLLTSVFLWSYGVLSPIGGFFADKYGRKKVIVFSVFVWSVVTLWTGFTQSFGSMLAARLVMGISEACYIPAGLALITDYHRGRTRSLATGIHMSGLYAGLAIGGIGGYIAELWGWRYGFQIFGGFGILYSLVLLKFLKDAPQEATETTVREQSPMSLWENLRLMFTQSSFLLLLLYFSVLGVVNWMVNGWLPTFFKEQFHLDLGKAGLSATGYIQIGSFAGVLLGGFLADRWVVKNNRGRLYVLIIGFTLGAPFLFLMASTNAFIVAVVAMIIFGLGRGFNDSNLMPVLRQIADQRYVATGYGFLNFLSTIIGGVMVYAGGALKDSGVGFSIVYQWAAVALLLATWTLLAIKIKTK